MRLWRRRKSEDDDPYRPLSEKEKAFVEQDVRELSTFGVSPASAPPGAPVNVEDVSGLDLPLSEEERAFAQREVDEQLGHDEHPLA
jgi:hypothetical protein